MITLSINVKRIEKERIKPGKNGQYLDLVLVENRDGPDSYGNDGFVAHSVSKDERESGIRGSIIGNWKRVGEQTRRERQRPTPRPSAPKKPASNPDLEQEEDDIPF